MLERARQHMIIAVLVGLLIDSLSWGAEGAQLGSGAERGCKIVVEPEFSLGLSSEQHRQLVDQTVAVLQNRIRGFGASESTVSHLANDRISIQVWGIPELETCEQIIDMRGVLEFKKALKSSSVEGDLKTEDSRQEILKSRECYIEKLKDTCQEYMVDTEPLLTGSALEPGKQQMVVTQPSPSNPSPIVVSLTFNQDGAQKFKDAILRVGPDTAQDANRLAIVLDKQVYSAPVIRADLYNDAKAGKPIRQAQITGRFTVNEGKLLTSALNAGALPTNLKILEKEALTRPKQPDWLLLAGAAALALALIYVISRARNRKV